MPDFYEVKRGDQVNKIHAIDLSLAIKNGWQLVDSTEEAVPVHTTSNKPEADNEPLSISLPENSPATKVEEAPAVAEETTQKVPPKSVEKK